MNPNHLHHIAKVWQGLARRLTKGESVLDALRAVAEQAGPVADHVRAMADAVADGSSVHDALEAQPALWSASVGAIVGAHEEVGSLVEAADHVARALEAGRLPTRRFAANEPITARDAHQLFWQALEVMCRAGVPLQRTLLSLSKDFGDHDLALIVRRVADLVQAGSTLSVALGEFPNAFGATVRSMVAAGERGGVVEQAAEAIAADIEQGFIDPARREPASPVVVSIGEKRPKRDHQRFWRQVSRMIHSCGAPILEAMITAAWDTKNGGLFTAVSEVAEAVRGGSTVHEALTKQRHEFGQSECDAIRIGEEQGEIDRVAMELSVDLDPGDLLADDQAGPAPDEAKADHGPGEPAKGEDGDTVHDMLASFDDGSEHKPAEDSIDIESLEEMSHIAPVRKLLNLVLLQAIKDNASDIHFEPLEDEFRIRYRIDGVLYEMVPPPKHLARAVISRIKVMANIDIAERRRATWGRVEVNISGHRSDLLVHILPCLDGERCTISISGEATTKATLSSIDLAPGHQATLREWLARPHGIVLATGPAGSGKTTTLYAIINDLNRPDRAIITVEDPVHSKLDRVSQTRIMRGRGFDRPRAIEAALAQNCDVLMLSDLPDVESVDAACQAALTGRLVLSSLPVGDAPAAAAWLLDMGCRPHLVSATLVGVTCQRLVRQLCDCRFEVAPDALPQAEQEFLGDSGIGKAPVPKGCDQCYDTGYRGRVAVYEFMEITDAMRRAIVKRADAGEIRKLARAAGMRPLRDDGLAKVEQGVTSVAELMRALAF